MKFSIRSRQELEKLENDVLAPYAAKSEDALKTRANKESPHPYRTEFQRDRDRIIHSRAFRRLKHKRQVFLTHEGDHYRTRLTHTLEVSQLSRTVGKACGLNEELIEAIALGHDLGHTPFGHVGEIILHKIMSGKDNLDGVMLDCDCGGFKHNHQSLRVVDKIEKKYKLQGLNLTAPVREGILKHTKLRLGIINYPNFNSDGLHLEQAFASTLEGQVVAMCDEIAQHTHDLEDGIRAHFVDITEIKRLQIIKKLEKELNLKKLGGEDPFLYQNLMIKGLINLLVTDIIQTTIENLEQYYTKKQRRDIFELELVSFSKDLEPLHGELDKYIDDEVIYHASIYRADDKAISTIRTLFKMYIQNPSLLPSYTLKRLTDHDIKIRGEMFFRIICDHIAGMTDNFAETELQKLQTKASVS